MCQIDADVAGWAGVSTVSLGFDANGAWRFAEGLLHRGAISLSKMPTYLFSI